MAEVDERIAGGSIIAAALVILAVILSSPGLPSIAEAAIPVLFILAGVYVYQRYPFNNVVSFIIAALMVPISIGLLIGFGFGMTDIFDAILLVLWFIAALGVWIGTIYDAVEDRL